MFIFQIGSTLITGSNTTVSLVNGAQACNVFWQVGSSATLGTGTRFVGTVMASATITANTAATIHGRLLAQTGAVNLDTNTITTSNCASSASGGSGGGGTETTTPAEAATLAEATALAEAVGSGATPGATTTPLPPIGSRTVGKHGKHRSRRPNVAHHSSRRHRAPHGRRSRTSGARSPAERSRPALPESRARLLAACRARLAAHVVLAGAADGRARRPPPRGAASSRAGDSAARRPAHRTRCTPGARSRIPADRARARPQADHRRADHPARDRTPDRSRRGPVATGDASRSPQRHRPAGSPSRAPASS